MEIDAPPSFTARRPHASNLPSFELPPPPVSGTLVKYPASSSSYWNAQPTAPLPSVGNLLTPPASKEVTPANSYGLPPSTSQGTDLVHISQAPYGFQSSGEQQSGHGRGLFSPSLNSIVRGRDPDPRLPPPPYEVPQYTPSSPPVPISYKSSLSQYAAATTPMSAPSLPAVHSQMIGNAMMGGQMPVSASMAQASPVHSQEAFPRPPPTPAYYDASQLPSTTTTHSSSSPVQQSMLSAHGPTNVSVVDRNGFAPLPPPHYTVHPQPYQRPHTYPLAGPILSNLGNPVSVHLQMVGGLPQSVIPGYNSGHAAQKQPLPRHPQQPPLNDRPFRCDQCPQSFNRNHDLKRHKRIHLEVKPFPCGHCDKSFSRKEALKRHVLVGGCGKTHAVAEIAEVSGSNSPNSPPRKIQQDVETDSPIQPDLQTSTPDNVVGNVEAAGPSELRKNADSSNPAATGTTSRLGMSADSISSIYPPDRFELKDGQGNVCWEAAVVPIDTRIEVEMEDQIAQDAEDPLEPSDRGTSSELDAVSTIDAAMLAKHHLPSIMLGNGPRPIRYLMDELTQSISAFSRIPPSKARRLVITALESRQGGGADGNVVFHKTGWGRWDAYIRDSSKDSASESFDYGIPSPPPTKQPTTDDDGPIMGGTEVDEARSSHEASFEREIEHEKSDGENEASERLRTPPPTVEFWRSSIEGEQSKSIANGTPADGNHAHKRSEVDTQNATTAQDHDRPLSANDMIARPAGSSDAISTRSPSEATSFSRTPSSSTSEDGSATPMARDSVPDQESVETSPLQRSPQAGQGSTAVRVGALQRLENLLARLELLADELSCSTFDSPESDEESRMSVSSSADTLCDRESFDGLATVETLTSNPSNGPADGVDSTNGSTGTPPQSEKTHNSSNSTGSGIGNKRPLSFASGDGCDDADDGNHKRPRKSQDWSDPDADQPHIDGREQIPCFMDGCSGKDVHISELIRKCAKHHTFFVCTRCYLSIENKSAFEHHRATGEGCEPHCISSSCCPKQSEPSAGTLLKCRHKRKSECPPDKKVSVRDRWQYLYHLRYPERPLLSLVFQLGLSHPHGTGRPKAQRKPHTKTPASTLSEQFRQQLAEARNEIQTLRTQQALDAAMREFNEKEHDTKIMRLEMVIAACVELIPRIPGHIRRMIEVDAGGALKMIAQPSASAQVQFQGPTSFPTPSQGASSSPEQALASRDENFARSDDFFTHGGADFCDQDLFDPTLPVGLPILDDEAS